MARFWWWIRISLSWKVAEGINSDSDLYFVCFLFFGAEFWKICWNDQFQFPRLFQLKSDELTNKGSRTWWKKPQRLKVRKHQNDGFLFWELNRDRSAGPVQTAGSLGLGSKKRPQGAAVSASIQLQVSLLRVRELCTGEASSNLGDNIRLFPPPPETLFRKLSKKTEFWNKTWSVDPDDCVWGH